MKWRELQHPKSVIQFKSLSLRIFDSICIPGTVHLEILSLHLNADLLFSPRSSWWTFQSNYWYVKTNGKFATNIRIWCFEVMFTKFRNVVIFFFMHLKYLYKVKIMCWGLLCKEIFSCHFTVSFWKLWNNSALQVSF